MIVIWCLLQLKFSSLMIFSPIQKGDRHIPSSLLLTFSLAGFHLAIWASCFFTMLFLALLSGSLCKRSESILRHVQTWCLSVKNSTFWNLFLYLFFTIMFFMFIVFKCSACVKQTVIHSLFFPPPLFCTLTFSFSLTVVWHLFGFQLLIVHSDLDVNCLSFH